MANLACKERKAVWHAPCLGFLRVALLLCTRGDGLCHFAPAHAPCGTCTINPHTALGAYEDACPFIERFAALPR